MKINDEAAVGEFTPDRKLVDYKANMYMSKRIAEMTAQFSATVSKLFNTLASAFTQLRCSGYRRRYGHTLAVIGLGL